ncbi:protein bride of sevenless-like [Amphibalanus amphitrite]|uniref:protein bride of sevenless-like n=1 Tax=Amphibalanus amphitrite TaxID=1232801 RepID=UPI001C907961|nr:protein bride of sevenless-like [Amphibalanus amphitrite]
MASGGALDSLFTVPGRVQPGEPADPEEPAAAAASALGLRRQVWVIPVMVIAAMNVLAMLSFEAYVLFKVSRTAPSRRHVMLGQALLAGLLLASLTAGAHVFEPSVASCAVIRLGTGLAYSLMFAALLVKCVFLISLNGGVYLPANYQALLLFFVVLTQLAISAQWLAVTPPAVADGACAASFHVHLLTLLYPLFLLVLVACVAARSRRIKDNYREAAYIGVASALSVLVWCTWVVAGLVAAPLYRDASVSLGLAVNATLVFLVMFMPKGRQLAAMGRQGVRRDDREDRLSLSYADPRAASPSFYHFRPVKVQPADRRRKSGPVAVPLPLPSYYQTPYLIPRCSGYIRQDDNNMYNTIDHIKSQYRAPAERTLSAGNPNVFFYRTPPHPGMMY